MLQEICGCCKWLCSVYVDVLRVLLPCAVAVGTSAVYAVLRVLLTCAVVVALASLHLLVCTYFRWRDKIVNGESTMHGLFDGLFDGLFIVLTLGH